MGTKNKTDHVNLPVVLLDSGTQEEGEEQFVFLKQRSADIGVETEGEEIVDVLHSLFDVVSLWKKKFKG